MTDVVAARDQPPALLRLGQDIAPLVALCDLSPADGYAVGVSAPLHRMIRDSASLLDAPWI